MNFQQTKERFEALSEEEQKKEYEKMVQVYRIIESVLGEGLKPTVEQVEMTKKMLETYSSIVWSDEEMTEDEERMEEMEAKMT